MKEIEQTSFVKAISAVGPASASETHPLLVQQITAKIAEVLQVLIQERAHEHIDPSFFGSAVVGKRVKLALTLRKRCLKRRWHGHVESFQAVPQDVTMKVRQAEVYFPRHPGKLEELMQNEGLLWARLEVQAALRFSAWFFPSSIF